MNSLVTVHTAEGEYIPVVQSLSLVQSPQRSLTLRTGHPRGTLQCAS
jgi:hypothetical protein